MAEPETEPGPGGESIGAWLRSQRLAHSWTIAEMGRQVYQAGNDVHDNSVSSVRIIASYVRRWTGGWPI